MDIRKWLVSSKGATNTSKPEKEKNSKAKAHDNDDFDIKQKKGEQAKKPKKRARVISDSDSDEDVSPSKKRSVTPKQSEKSPGGTSKKELSRNRMKTPEKKSSKKEHVKSKSPKLKATTSEDFFGSEPVARNNKRTAEGVKKSREDSSVIHDDEDFNKTLKQLDKPGKKSHGDSSVIHDDDEDFSKTLAQLDSSEKKNKRAKKEEKQSKAISEIEIVKDSHNEKSLDKKVPKTKPTSSSDDTGFKPKTEKEVNKEALAAQKRREGYMLYKSFLDREGPKALGSKEIPEGEEGCLLGMSFIITGILESIDRDDAKTLIEKYGGKVMASVTKNTKYVVVGRDPGPGKMKKAETFGTKQLDEDGLFELIRTSPGNSRGAQKKGKAPLKNFLSDSGLGSSGSEPTAPVAHELIKSFRREPKKSHTTEEFTSSQTNDSSTNGFSPKLKKSPLKQNSLEDITDSKQSVSKQITSDASQIPVFEMWVDKYKPTSLKQVIGQQGDKSNAKKLLHWLLNWGSKTGKAKKPFPGKWNSQDDGSSFKAALLSGPPGVGKTTTAQLVCKEAGFDYFELNASDTRSKKTLKEVVAELFGNQTLAGCFKEGNSGKVTSRHVIIMDEVDGMAGNEDRGGVQELIGLIKSSHIPVICICNDRSHPKIRSLSNYCFDLRFQKPRVEQIKAAMMSVTYKEELKISPNVLQDVIVSSNQDVRQVLHNLSMWTAKDKGLSEAQAKSDIGKGTKHIKMSPFDVLREVFAIGNKSKATVNDKAELFFHDYSIGPLFVQENYLHVNPRAASSNKVKHLHLLSEAANSICDGDIIERQIRSGNNWSLLPTQAVFSSVIPGELLTGYLNQMINFPAWLGKNSNRNYMDRILQELQMHMRMKITGNKTEVAMDYLPLLRKTLTKPLLEEEADGIPETLSTMDQYYLLREDFDNIIELSMWPNQTDPRTKISPKVKSAFTRAYNKESGRNPYSVQNVTKKKRGQGMNSDLLGEEGGGGGGENPVSEEEEEDESVENDAMVKVKKPSKKSSANEDAPSTSKKGEKTSKRGRSKKT